jgi:hypothetical protein
MKADPAERLRDMVVARVAQETGVPADKIRHSRQPGPARARMLAMTLIGGGLEDREVAELFKTTRRTVQRARSMFASTTEREGIARRLLQDPVARDLRAKVAVELGWDDDIASE